MRFGKIVIYILTFSLCLLIIYAGLQETEAEQLLCVEITVDNHTERIDSHVRDSDYYLFLPGPADWEQTQLSVTGKGSFFLNDQPLTDGLSCSHFTANCPYTLRSDKQTLGTVTLLQSSGVGAMFLDVASGNMDYIHAKKGNKETGALRLYTPDGRIDYEGSIAEINGRGNSTWDDEKKSYSVELSSEADLFGMGSAKNWILLSNCSDSSNLRNKIVMDFAKEFGLPYSPGSQWVDLYLNGEYAGLYLLCERNEVHPNRVDIPQEGSFLVAKDLRHRFEEAGYPYIATEHNTALRIYHSDWSHTQLQTLWQSVENAILSENGIDPVTGKHWQELIDAESWLKRHLIDEVFGNVDGGKLSQFYYVNGSDPTGKIYAGPVWDYDLTMRMQGSHQTGYVEMFFVHAPGDETSLWPVAFYQKPDYYEKLIHLYESQFCPLLDVYMQTTIPQYMQHISAAAEMNAIRWNISDHKEYTEQILTYMTLRKAFLDKVWLEKADYHYINALDASGSTRYFAVEQGQPIKTLPKFESDDPAFVYRWYNAETGELFLPEDPVTADVEIYMCYEPVDAAP